MSDVVTDHGFGHLLQAKLGRYTAGGTSLGFKNTRVALKFHKWLEEVESQDPLALLQAYIATLKVGIFGDKPYTKTTRFLLVQGITAALSVIPGLHTLGSIGINTASSFLLERLSLGFRALYFVDDLHQEFLDN